MPAQPRRRGLRLTTARTTEADAGSPGVSSGGEMELDAGEVEGATAPETETTSAGMRCRTGCSRPR